MICAVEHRLRPALAGCALFAVAWALAACSSPPAPRATPTTTTFSTSTTTTTTTSPTTTSPTTTSPPTTLPQGVGVPDVLGMKIDLAHFYLQVAGFAVVPLNAPCDKGTLPSQSVVASLSVPGRPPTVTVGAQPLLPGTLLQKGSRVGVTWSGCYPAGTTVPLVTGHTFASAVHLLHLAALNWACYSVGSNPTTTTAPPAPTGPTSSTTAPPPTTTTTTPRQRVISQGTKAGTTAQAGAVVTLFMHHCPQ